MSYSEFIFSESLFNHDTGTDSSFCLEDGSRSDSVRGRLERAVQREDSNAVRKFEISEATSWGRVVVRCLTFLPTHLEPVIQRVNHVDSLKELVKVEWNRLDWNM